MMLGLLLLVSLQQTDVRAQLTARGLPAELAASVAVTADSARRRGLPVEPLVNKAIEGWAKRVAAARIQAAVTELSGRLATARDILVGGNVRTGGPVIAASAEALARGISSEAIVQVAHSAPDSVALQAGLSVAAALAAHGLDRATAVRLVVDSYRSGRSVAQVLDLPAAAASLLGGGMPPAAVGRRLLEGVRAGGSVQGLGRIGGDVRPPPIPGGLEVPGVSKRP